MRRVTHFAAKVPVVGDDEIIVHLGGKMSKKNNSGTVNSLFQAICEEYWNFHIKETTALSDFIRILHSDIDQYSQRWVEPRNQDR